jgi:hypothetical protein
VSFILLFDVFPRHFPYVILKSQLFRCVSLMHVGSAGVYCSLGLFARSIISHVGRSRILLCLSALPWRKRCTAVPLLLLTPSSRFLLSTARSQFSVT